MGKIAPEWNCCLLMKAGWQLNFEIMFLVLFVNLVYRIPDTSTLKMPKGRGRIYGKGREGDVLSGEGDVLSELT
jgi:hypothetical protein